MYSSVTGNLNENTVNPFVLLTSLMSPSIFWQMALLQDSPRPMLQLLDFLAPTLFLISHKGSKRSFYLSYSIPSFPVSITCVSSMKTCCLSRLCDGSFDCLISTVMTTSPKLGLLNFTAFCNRLKSTSLYIFSSATIQKSSWMSEIRWKFMHLMTAASSNGHVVSTTISRIVGSFCSFKIVNQSCACLSLYI